MRLPASRITSPEVKPKENGWATCWAPPGRCF